MGKSLSLGNILIVDDTPTNLRLLSQMLTGRGYRVRAARNGPLAISAAQSAPPDLILLDIMMPDMDGYEVCRRLKADERTQDIPIVFISALGEVGEKVKAFTYGGVDFITKPFEMEEVLARVETHLALRRLREELERTNRELEVQVQELDAFAHTVAHDLKSPLSLVIGYAELLAEELGDTSNALVRESVEAVLANSNKMTIIIKELLLLAGVRKAGEVALESLDMAAVVSGALERLAAEAAETGAKIILPPSWPAALGYAPWVEEVWSNYISNAIKYGGQPPRVELGADRAVPQDAAGMVRFWVRDNGGGLTPEEQGRLFAEFTRLYQVQAEGTGLGLSIVRRIVERLGGRVGVESAPGAGSLFYFTLPTALSPR
jgi:signal transduction histidine kinase